MAVKMACQVRFKSGYEVESLPFDKLLKETEPIGNKISCKMLCLFGQRRLAVGH